MGRRGRVGELEFAEPGDRPSNVVALDDVELDEDGDKMVAEAAGSVKSGLKWSIRGPGAELAIPHCHSAEEEAFVVLEGEGTLELWPSPVPASRGVERETHAIRAGHVVARPAGTRISHFIKAGRNGITCLVYGTREPNDICYYPRSNKISLARCRRPRPDREPRLLGRRAARARKSTACRAPPRRARCGSSRPKHRTSRD